MRKYIFCINSGRAGSQYLSKLLSTAKDIQAFHEPHPQMINKHLDAINNYDYSYSYNDRCIKVDAINKLTKNWNSNTIYVETSHMFIKTFWDVIINELEGDIKVVSLKRDLPKVLKSFIELSYFNRNGEALKWMSLPDAKTATVKCIKPYYGMNHYEKCIAYLIDIEGRREKFTKEYSDRISECRLERLNDMHCVNRVFKELDIQPTNRTNKLLGQKINVRNHRKKHFNVNVNLDYCKEMFVKYVKQAIKLDIELPKRIKDEFGTNI